MSVKTKDHCIDDVFGNTKYYIDFYQRDYKWQKIHVESLLDDIFYKFDNEYRTDIDVNKSTIGQFGWYYLSTYVTNNYKEKKFIVDGQQRFTTLTLILIKLYHLAEQFGLKERSEWIRRKIYGVGSEGPSYWMGENDRTPALDELFQNKQQKNHSTKNISLNNIYQNYAFVDSYLNEKLNNPHKFNAFLMYFMRNVKLVEIIIEDAKDVSMVFEVINDRGEALKPYEIFKGKLLGQLEKHEVDDFYSIWTTHIQKLQSISEREVDNFFISYFRSKYTDTRSEQEEFDEQYYKTIFSKKWNSKFKLHRNPNAVRAFIKEGFRYYSDLYKQSLDETFAGETFLYYNYLNDQHRQYQLIMSAVRLNDPEKDKKVELVAYHFDRYFTLLQLFGCYDSNRLTQSIVELTKNLRDKQLSEIGKIFDSQLLYDINDAKSMQIIDPFQWTLFRDTKNLNKTFTKYFFARIDHFIAEEANLKTFDYEGLVRKTGKESFHIEHILADNQENKSIFNNDEELFYSERDRLGSLLLLKGRDNQSSNNEVYADKLKTYTHETLWAQTLTAEFYHANKDFEDLKEKYALQIEPIVNFDKNAIDIRQRLLFEMVRIIWGLKVG